MIALVVVLIVIVVLLAILVAGLLRSHADILKALHDLGVGVGDPAVPADTDDIVNTGDRIGTDGPTPVRQQVPLTIGPPLPAERSSSSAPTIAGVTPSGDALALAPAGSGQLTLLAFLSSGCASCAGFWQAFDHADDLGLPAGTRLAVVTKGPEFEIPAEVAARATPGLVVVMSTDAWGDYEVPGSPFFVLVDGRSGRRIGEGVANHFSQVAELVRRAHLDAEASRTGGSGSLGIAAPSHHPTGLDGPERERANDQELLDAGILPGDPSLYPTSLEAIVGPGHRAVRAEETPAVPAARAG